MATFGERLRLLREERGLVQKEIGALIGVDESSVSKYELDQRTPPPNSIIILANHFNVSTDYLLGVSNSRLHVEEVIVDKYDNASFEDLLFNLIYINQALVNKMHERELVDKNRVHDLLNELIKRLLDKKND